MAKEIQINLSEKDINSVLTALSKYPYDQVAVLINKIGSQIDAFKKAEEESKKSTEETPKE